MRQKLGMFVLAAFVSLFVYAAAPLVVSGVSVQKIEPLGLVIDYVVSEVQASAEGLAPAVTLTVGGKVYAAETLSGGTSTTEGNHRIYWNLAADGVAAFTEGEVSVTYKEAPYCVIDLEDGEDVTSYPVTYLASEPEGDGFNTNEYKSEKLVLKRVVPGSFIMGEDQANAAHKVTLTQSFYMGLFEVTQEQWMRVMGKNPSKFWQGGEICPVECVSYYDVRGKKEGAKWPESNAVDEGSFLGELRKMTGLDFDLPTEAQWEYTCRAGTTTKWSFGDDESDAGDYMWYKGNAGITYQVGRKKPNPLGFYDMHGNVLEMCVDWYSDELAYGTDPKGWTSASKQCVWRGGSWINETEDCSSAFRYGQGCTARFTGVGLRLARTLSNENPEVVPASARVESVPVITAVEVQNVELFGVTVDYTCETMEGATAAYTPVITATTKDGKTVYTAKTLTDPQPQGENKCRVFWNMVKDGVPSLENATISVTLKKKLPEYCVVDLSGGNAATSFPVTYLEAEPEGGFNIEEYKTEKLVLKRVDAGSFIMGENQSNEAHRVTLTNPFFMGIFEMTQRQWQLVMGWYPDSRTDKGKGYTYPVYFAGYNRIRGSSEGKKWPATNTVNATSFLGELRKRTGLDLDLPTEAQWEYTCRAGTTTKWSFGDDESAADDYMWYLGNAASKTFEVGTKKANPWGFYDMHGNVVESCLDWQGTLTYGTNPRGASSDSYRVVRGGAFSSKATNCASSYRNGYSPSSNDTTSGFRLSLPINQKSSNTYNVDNVTTSVLKDGAADGFFAYTENADGSTVTITGFGEVPLSGTELVFPDLMNGKPVTGIADKAFLGAQNITSVTLPIFLEQVGYRAFHKASALKELNIPSVRDWENPSEPGSLTIGEYAFAETLLSEVCLPEEVTEVGAKAFNGCQLLETVTILGAPKVGENVLGNAGIAVNESPTIRLDPELMKDEDYKASLSNLTKNFGRANTPVAVRTDAIVESVAPMGVSVGADGSVELPVEIGVATKWDGVDTSRVRVEYSESLAGLTDKPDLLTPTVDENEDGTFLISVTPPDEATSGFFRVKILK